MRNCVARHTSIPLLEVRDYISVFGMNWNAGAGPSSHLEVIS